MGGWRYRSVRAVWQRRQVLPLGCILYRHEIYLFSPC
ncbi:hypothetical protein DJ90_6461 [Paenibacillus macerans]|uniref:Uncharacterized protein n=1 Tax=Paenibacillus macerans TaxID=44252 RepID=A0A090Y5W7_PAEMA|nr:hypothetical protein DJ90_6461 [Paenibacillus macerans]